MTYRTILMRLRVQVIGRGGEVGAVSLCMCLYIYGLSMYLAILCSCINLLTSICTSVVYLSI